jgi:uncharacterized phage protein (predicted DNA packaging)
MTALLTLDVAKKHLRVDHADDDADITRKIDQASAIVLDYIKQRDAAWTADDVPPVIAAATEIVLSMLYDDRAAGGQENGVAMGYLPLSVTSLLHRYRDPALA